MKLIDTDIAKTYIKQSDLKSSEKMMLLSCISSMPNADISKLQPKPTEAIVMSLNTQHIDQDKANELFNSIQSVFSENVVIAIPDYISLRSCSKDTLEKIMSMLSATINNL